MKKYADSVFLSSTDYDQMDFRDSLFELLNKYGFSTFTFHNAENTPYPIHHSHDECLNMIDKMNCVIGIVGTRSGNKYVGTKHQEYFRKLNCPNNLSITYAEIIYALEKRKIPTIILIRKGVWDMRKNGGLKEEVRNFLDYLTRRPKGNYLHIDVSTVKEAFSIITSKVSLIPQKRLYLLGEAMEGEGWNGKYFFNDKEVTVQNRNADGYTALNDLRVVGKDLKLIEREDRLKWMIKLLSDKNMIEEDCDFLIKYILEYTGYLNIEGDIKEQVENEVKVINLIQRMRFGDVSVFGGYKHSIRGGIPVPLRWPKDAKKWSAHARLEFILYSLRLENSLPVNLRRMIEFSAAINSSTGEGFIAHYSRKPATVGCANACEVRLSRHNGQRGINEKLEMKSMLYIAKIPNKFLLIAVHGEGNKDVKETSVLREISKIYYPSIKQIPRVDSKELTSYLKCINSPDSIDVIESGRRLSMNGAQEVIGLYASAINPVSILKSVEFKLSYIQQYIDANYFDVLMLWDENVYNLQECYNNAGSPTWGLRFKPKDMFDHVKINAEIMVERFRKNSENVNFSICLGNFFAIKNN